MFLVQHVFFLRCQSHTTKTHWFDRIYFLRLCFVWDMRRFLVQLSSACRGNHSCLRRFVSEEWRPHSEQLKLWIAASSSDAKAASSARAYVYNLNCTDTLKSFDDVVDFCLAVSKIQYPREGKAAAAIQGALCRSGATINTDDLSNLCRLAAVHPDAALDVFVSVLSNGTIVEATDQLLRKMPFESLLSLCETVWRLTTAQCSEALSPFLSSAAHHLGVYMRNADHPVDSMVCIINANAPLSFPSLRELRAALVDSTIRLSCHDAVTVAEAASSRRRSLDPTLVNALQCSFTRDLSVPSERETARFMHALSVMDGCATSKLVSLVQLTAAQCTEDALFSLSIAVHHQLVTNPHNKELFKMRNSIARRTRVDLLKKAVSFPSKVCLVASLSEIDPLGARKLFDDMVQQTPGAVQGADLTHLLTAMVNTDVYPAAALRRIETVTVETLCERTCVYALYVLTVSKSGASEKLFNKCLASHGLQKHSRRFKSPISQPPIKDNGVTVLLLLCLLQNENSEAEATAQLLLREWNPTRFDVHILFTHANHIQTIKTETTQAIVTAAIRHVTTLNSEEIEAIFVLMAKSNCRNAAVFERGLERLASLDPPFTAILCAASCAQRLCIGALFERSPIIARVGSLTDVSDRDVVRFLRVCPSAERARIAELRQVDSMATKLPLATVETPELLTLFAVLRGKDARRRVLVEVQTRAVASVEEVSPEDALVAVEAASRSEQVRELFRIGGPSLQRVDEGQLARLQLKMSSVNPCPNVCFRVVGRALLQLADRLSVESALAWLSLYMAHNIRDDSVSKALIRKVNSRSASLSRSAAKQLAEATRFFGLEQAKSPPKRGKRKSTALISSRDSTW